MDTAEIVTRWFNEHIARGAVARDTEAYNQVHQALPALIAAIEGAGTATAPKPAEKAAPAPGK